MTVAVFVADIPTEPPSYEPQPGYHRPEEGRPWCENSGDPHEGPAGCSTNIGIIDADEYVAHVSIYHGQPCLSFAPTNGDETEVLDPEHARLIAAWLERAASLTEVR